MSYADAIELIGLPIENKKSHRLYKALDVRPQGDGSYLMYLSGGQLIPIETMDEHWKPAESVVV